MKKIAFAEIFLGLFLIFIQFGCNAVADDEVFYGTIGASLEKEPPRPVENIQGITSESSITLKWDNPSDLDLYGVKIVPGNGAVDSSKNALNSITLINNNRSLIPTSQTYNGLNKDTEYTFTIYSLDKNLNMSGGATAKFKTEATVSSNFNVENLVASAGDKFVKLSWTIMETYENKETGNISTMEVYGIKIKVTSDDGTVFQDVNLIENPVPTSYTFQNLKNDTNYSFSVYQFNVENDLSKAMTTTAKPTIDVNSIEVSDFEAVPGDGIASLSWVNPNSEDFIGVLISSEPAEGSLLNPIYFINTSDRSKIPSSLKVESLRNNSSYTFTIKTLNKKYYESRGVVASAYPKENANLVEVTNFVANPGDGCVTLTWNEPVSSDTTKIIGVMISAETSDSSAGLGILEKPVYFIDEKDSSNIPTSLVVENLDNDVTYTFKIHTLSEEHYLSAGVSDAKSPKANKNDTDVTSLIATAKDSFVNLEWTFPDNASSINGILITANPADGTLSNPIYYFADSAAALPKSLKVEGLTNEKSYDFTVNTIDTSNYLSPGKKVQSIKPTKNVNNVEVGNLKALAGDGYVELSWDSITSSNIIGVKISATSLNSTQFGNLKNPVYFIKESSDSSIPAAFKVEGLENGKVYTFTVQTLSDVYYLSESGNSVTALPAKNENDAPVTVFNAEPKDGFVELSWINPASTANTKVIGVVVSAKSTTPSAELGTLKEPVYFLDSYTEGANKTLKVEGLSNGAVYNFSIKSISSQYYFSAEKSVDQSPSKNLNNIVVENFNVASGDGRVSLTWKKPESSATTEIIGVMINAEASDSSASCGILSSPVYFIDESGNYDIPESLIVENLKNDTLYTFSIYSLSKEHYLSTEKVSKSATPKADANNTNVDNFNAVSRDSKISLSWEIPTSASIKGILLEAEPNEGTLKNPIYYFGDNLPVSIDVEGLTNGTQYNFKISTINDKNYVSAKKNVFATPVKNSNNISVKNFKALAGDGYVELTWDKPSSSATTEVIGVLLRASCPQDSSASLGMMTNDIYFIDETGSLNIPTSFKALNLDNGKQYDFEIYTLSRERYLSEPVSAYATPMLRANTVEVAAFDKIAGDGYVELTWETPSSADIIGVKISATGQIGSNLGNLSTPVYFMDDSPVPSLPDSFKVEGLENGKEYYFKIQTLNRAYYLSTTGMQVSATPLKNENDVPVTLFRAEPNDGFVTLSWTNPASTAKTEIIGVVISAQSASSEASLGTLKEPIYFLDSYTEGEKTLKVEGLSNNKSYSFSIKTVSSQYYFSSENIIEGVVPAKNLNITEVKNFQAAAKDKTVELSWSYPESAVDAKIIGILISAKNITSGVSCGSLSVPINFIEEKGLSFDENGVPNLPTSFKVENLTNGAVYSFKIQTINSQHYYSEGVDTSANPEKAKNIMSVTMEDPIPDDGSMTLNWQNPSEDDFFGLQIYAEVADSSDTTSSLGTISQPVYFTKMKDGSEIPETLKIEGLTNGTKYNFYINTLDKNLYLSEISQSKSGIPHPLVNRIEVSNLRSSATDKSVRIYWKVPADTSLIKSYIITIGGSGLDPININDVDTETFAIKDLENEKTYTIVVQTVDNFGNHSIGDSVTATPTTATSAFLNPEEFITYKRKHTAYDFGYASSPKEHVFSMVATADFNLQEKTVPAIKDSNVKYFGEGSFKVSFRQTTVGKSGSGSINVESTDTFDAIVTYNPPPASTPSWDEADIDICGTKLRVIASNFKQPKDVATPSKDLRAWIRTDLVTDDDLSGKNVKSVPDYSGNGFDANSIDPSYVTTPIFYDTDDSFNGNPVVDFSCGMETTGQTQQQGQLYLSGAPIVNGSDGSTVFAVFNLGRNETQHNQSTNIISANFGSSWPVLKLQTRYYSNTGFYISGDYKYGFGVKAFTDTMTENWRYACISADTTNPFNRYLVTSAPAAASGLSPNDRIAKHTLSTCLVYDKTINQAKVPNSNAPGGYDFNSNIRMFVNGDERLLAYIDSTSTYTEAYLKEAGKNRSMWKNDGDSIDLAHISYVASTATTTPTLYGYYGRPFGDGKGHRYGNLTSVAKPENQTKSNYQAWMDAAKNAVGRRFDTAFNYNDLVSGPAAVSTSAGTTNSNAWNSYSYRFLNSIYNSTTPWKNGKITTLHIGPDTVNSTQSYARFAEVIAFEGALSDEDIAAVNNYMKYRYNLPEISTNVDDYGTYDYTDPNTGKHYKVDFDPSAQ